MPPPDTDIDSPSLEKYSPAQHFPFRIPLCSLLFAAAAVLVPVATTSAQNAPKVLFIGSAGEATQGADGAVWEKMIEWWGEENLTYIQSGASTTEDAAAVDVVVLSSTPGSGDIRNKFHEVAVGVVNWEEAIARKLSLGELGITTGNRQKYTTVSEITIEDSNHLITEGFPATVQLLENPVEMWGSQWGFSLDSTDPIEDELLAPGAKIIANISKEATEDAGFDFRNAAIVAVEKGDPIWQDAGDPVPAPARRVMLPLTDNTANELTEDGWNLVKRSIEWTAGVLTGGGGGETYSQNFDAFADETTDLGDGTVMAGTAKIIDGKLQLTENDVAGGFASFSVPALADSSSGWTATFDLTISDGEGANEPADGMSFNYGNAELGELGSAEEGMAGIASVSENISFEIDTWQNLDAEQGVNIAEKVGGADNNLEFTNGPILLDGTEVSGKVTIVYDPVAGLSFSTTGLETNADFEGTATDFEGNDDYTFIISARVGGANETLTIDNLVITTETLGDPDLVAWWPLTEGTGEEFADSIGGNAAEFVDGEWGSADDGDDVPGFLAGKSVPSFDGGASYALLGEELIPVMDEDTAFSVAFWTNQVGGGTGVNEIILGNRYNLDGVDFAPREFIKFTPTKFEFHQEGGGAEDVQYPDPIPDDTWTHHAIVKEGNLFTYYRNGEEANTYENSGAYPINPQPLFIGGQQPGGEHWSGSLADIGLWKRSLSATDVAKIAAEGIASLVGGGGGPADLLTVARLKSDTSGLSFEVLNQGVSVVDKGSIAVTIDGVVVTTTVADIEGGVSVTYVANPAWLPGSVHPYNIVVKDTNGNDANRSGEGEGKVKDSLMPFNTPLVGPEGEAGLWGVRYIWGAGSPGTTTGAIKLIQASDDADFAGQVFDTTAEVANLGSGVFVFPDDLPYPDEVVAGDDGLWTGENFVVSYKGTLRITEGGLYTFGVHSDDGFGLRIFGGEFVSESGNGQLDPIAANTLIHPAPTGDSTTRGVANLAVGDYPIEFFWYENGGGDHGELYFAKGEFTEDTDTDTWELVGGEHLVGPGALPFQITNIVKAGTDVTITWQSTEGAGYTIERATPAQLATGEFEELQDGFEGQAGETSSYTDTGVADAEAYYRVRAE